jgi:hypothetical protein
MQLQEAPDPVPGTDHRARLEVRRSWARLIRQVYEVDPLLCPHCGGTMKVIAVIDRPAVIRQILEHLGLSTAAPSLRAPPDPPDGLAADQLREWSYEPLLDDLPASDPVMA